MGRHQELIGSGPVLAVLWLNILGSSFKVLIALAAVSQGVGENAARRLQVVVGSRVPDGQVSLCLSTSLCSGLHLLHKGTGVSGQLYGQQ